MLLKKNDSCLLLIDVQEKLTPLVYESEQLLAKCQWLMRLANDLKVPLLISEQYPRGLGKTVAVLQPFMENTSIIEKVSFSCWKNEAYQMALTRINKKQVILIGIETHVCVLQTALDLINANYEVFVVINAVASRNKIDHAYGLKRLKHNNVSLVTAEMVFFEWVEEAGTVEFRTLSSSYLK